MVSMGHLINVDPQDLQDRKIGYSPFRDVNQHITLSSNTGSQLRSWEGIDDLFSFRLLMHVGSTAILAILVDEVKIYHKPTTKATA